MMGLHGITDRTTAHGIPMLTITNDEIGSIFVDELLDEAPVGSEVMIMDYSRLLYRLGIFNNEDLDFAYKTLDDDNAERLQKRIAERFFFDARQGRESFLNLIVRTCTLTSRTSNSSQPYYQHLFHNDKRPNCDRAKSRYYQDISTDQSIH